MGEYYISRLMCENVLCAAVMYRGVCVGGDV